MSHYEGGNWQPLCKPKEKIVYFHVTVLGLAIPDKDILNVSLILTCEKMTIQPCGHISIQSK